MALGTGVDVSVLAVMRSESVIAKERDTKKQVGTVRHDKEVWGEIKHDGVACGCLSWVTKRKRRDEFGEGALCTVGKRACPWRIERLR